MVCYDPAIIGLPAACWRPSAHVRPTSLPSSCPSEVIHVPVLYGGEAGPDLHHVAEYNRLAEDDVINIHSSSDCLVYMLGFTPGFCYLGGMDQTYCHTAPGDTATEDPRRLSGHRRRTDRHLPH